MKKESLFKLKFQIIWGIFVQMLLLLLYILFYAAVMFPIFFFIAMFSKADTFTKVVMLMINVRPCISDKIKQQKDEIQNI
jgi:hypothetical protein